MSISYLRRFTPAHTLQTPGPITANSSGIQWEDARSEPDNLNFWLRNNSFYAIHAYSLPVVTDDFLTAKLMEGGFVYAQVFKDPPPGMPEMTNPIPTSSYSDPITRAVADHTEQLRRIYIFAIWTKDNESFTSQTFWEQFGVFPIQLFRKVAEIPTIPPIPVPPVPVPPVPVPPSPAPEPPKEEPPVLPKTKTVPPEPPKEEPKKEEERPLLPLLLVGLGFGIFLVLDKKRKP